MKTLRYLIPLLLITFGSFQSCKKDPPKKGSDNCCQFEGTVTRHYKGCVLTGNEPLAIRDKFENYFLVADDHTGLFQYMKEGDKVCFNYELASDCNTNFVPKQGIRFIPTTCVDLTCLKKRKDDKDCKCNDDNACSPIKPISYQQYTNKHVVPYSIMSGRIENDKLILKMSFSGCKDEDMELHLSEGPTMGPFPTYFGLLEYPKTACEMLITKEICFDISEYAQSSVFTIKDREGTKSFKR